MMDLHTFSDSMNELSPRYIEEACDYTPRRRRLPRFLAVGACIALVLLGTVNTLLRFDYLKAGCSAFPGTIVEGVYYYRAPHSGIYRYDPEEGSQKLLSAFWEDGYQVNEHGLFYSQGRSIRRMALDGSGRRTIYTAPLMGCSHMGFSLRADGNLVVTLYDNHAETRSQLLLDGESGEVLELSSYPYRNDALSFEESHLLLGEREVEMVPRPDAADANRGDGCYDLLENGVSLLPEGVSVCRWPAIYAHCLLFACCDTEEDSQTCFLLRDDGADQLLTLPAHYYCDEADGYLFFCDGSTEDSPHDGVCCLSLADGEIYPLALDTEWEFYDLTTDGELLYSCVPWNEQQTCWKLLWECGHPAALQLLDEDLCV